MMIVKFPLGTPKKCEGLGQSPVGLVVYAFGEKQFVVIRVIRGPFPGQKKPGELSPPGPLYS